MITAEARVKRKKYKLPGKTRQNKTVARGPKRLAERFYQLRIGHCRTGKYMEWTKNADTAGCGWCQYKTQTWNHLFKNCKQWKTKQKTLWAEVREATGRGKNRFTIRDLLADERAPIRFWTFCAPPGREQGGATSRATETGRRPNSRRGPGGR